MLNRMFSVKKTLDNLHKQVEYDLTPYRRILAEMGACQFEMLPDQRLQEKSSKLRNRVRERVTSNGITSEDVTAEAFALVREAARRVLGIRPFDTQVMAGAALKCGKLVEMQTGEGKTLAAVFPAYLHGLSGHGVHILTFNDYLARRDALWMGPVFDFLGLTVGYVAEGLTTGQRQAAYQADITYVTAKEAGFDYLRDFLCTTPERLVQRPFHFAIVDEADSIMIDEARVPLVIAGEVPAGAGSSGHLMDRVRELQAGLDFELDQNRNNVFLTDGGLTRLEERLGCGNLYNPENLDLLTRLNCALYAENLLERDKHYLVRNGKVEIIDEFTGRIAENRHWPDYLQEAVEIKEGLVPETKGRIMGSIALQHFLSLYPKLAGMTGTAVPAAGEFGEFYGMDVVVIPTHHPSRREDHPDWVFAGRQSKQTALAAEIKRVHRTGQPVLVGTGSVEESEQLAAVLMHDGIPCQVLNARNDELEAGIIAQAGEVGAVTVSTNMAGRGVDIKLGGVGEEERDRVIELGGLYVIGTNRHESRRIDDQLRGRAGRQGDPGESRFFVSLEDELIAKYDLFRDFPADRLREGPDGRINSPAVRRAVEHGQRVVEGYLGDIRRQLWKYSYILEEQRRIVHKKRMDLLTGGIESRLLPEKNPELYREWSRRLGTEVVREAEKQIALFHLNQAWAEYLEHISSERESIHLVVIGRKDPLTEFARIAIDAFEDMLARLDKDILETLAAVEITKEGIDLAKEGLVGPSSTWTYLINDNPDQFSRIPSLASAAATMISGPLFTARSIYRKISMKIKGISQ